MSDETLDIEAIQARADAATEGPWSAADEHGLLGAESGQAWCISRMGDETPDGPDERQWLYDVAEIAYHEPRPGGQSQADAEFIAHARSDVPALVAAVRLLRTQRDEATAENERWRQIGFGGVGAAESAADEHHAAVRAERDALQAVLRDVRELHQQIEGMGYEPDSGSSYGDMSSVCTTCGTSDEYGTKWPCQTVRLLDAALAAAVPVQPAEVEPGSCMTIGHDGVLAATVGTLYDGDDEYTDVAYCAECTSAMVDAGVFGPSFGAAPSPAVQPVNDETDKQR